MTCPGHDSSHLRRVLLYGHDTYGLGHLRRNLAIAGRLLRSRPGLQVVLMTGSSVADRFDLPDGLSLVRLPSVVKVGRDSYQPSDRRWDLSTVRRARSAVMADVAVRMRPDVFLVDHAPQGMKGELLPVFDALRSSSPATRIMLGLRDVLDDPATVRSAWTAEGVYETLGKVFDRILVYGSSQMLDVGEAYGLSDAVARRLIYTGYVCPPVEVRPRAQTMVRPFVLGTAGGGGDGVAALSATLAASRSLGIDCLLVTGPLMKAADRQRLRVEAGADPKVRTVELVADMGSVISSARAVVTMGGYNTLCELVARSAPTVVIPRIEPRREQAIRAELFAAAGLVSVVEPGRSLNQRLRTALAALFATPHRTGPGGLDLGGLDRVDAVLESEATTVRGRLPQAGRPPRRSMTKVSA